MYILVGVVLGGFARVMLPVLRGGKIEVSLSNADAVPFAVVTVVLRKWVAMFLMLRR